MKDKALEYNPHEIEKKWRKKWEEDKLYQPDLDSSKRPFYNLMMFPYPSAEGLHVGSVSTFTGVDTYGRFKRMQGYDVFEPIGLDGFGINAENYALKIGKHPKLQAQISEKRFYGQLSNIGNSYDWSRKVETYDSNYYRWTQWIFVQLFKRGLAYRKKAPVNFCPKDLTVLADEQVIDGHCERCGSLIEKRDLEQWFFKITDYAERLLNNIPGLNWTEKVKIAQRDWIGKKEGTIIKFQISNNKSQYIDVFTTRGDTLYGATFLVVAPEHPVVVNLESKEVQNYIKKAKEKTMIERTSKEKEKTGVFTGLYVINPLNNEEIPVWVADYASMEFGTGALFGDAHDDRDVIFARKYGIPLKPTLITGDKKRNERILKLKECFTGDGFLVNSGEFSGLSSKEARQKVADWLEKHGRGGRITTYHLRDWLISRQRYWGPPIPMIYCEKCKWQPVPEDQLPVLLPDVEDWKPKGTGTSPLANIPEFVNTTCPKCGGPARRETDVADTFLDSSWYFFRYISTEFDNKIFDQKRSKKWLPVTMYIGGAEHSVLHLLYSRFITMVFKDMGLTDFEEPYSRFYAHGLIIKEGKKMSKSRGNVVNPDLYLNKYGADTMRAYLRFVGPFDMGGDFRDSGIDGMGRFLKRVWRLFTQDLSSNNYYLSSEDQKMMHRTIKGVAEDLENLRFNTVIAKLMTWYNYLSSKPKISEEELKVFVQLLAPITPFLAEELWEKLGEKYSVHTSKWPNFSPKYLEENEATIVVQVNGKVRDTLRVESSKLKDESWVTEKAKESTRIKQHFEGKIVKKVIYVHGKILNFVLN